MMAIDGPRPIRSEEIPSLGRLLNRTFRMRLPGDMVEQFPHLINERNLPNLFVMAEEDEIVSHAGALQREIAFEGLTLTTALIGAVATDERCRGRGYATQCLNALLRTVTLAGADAAWISGGRGLYTSRGAEAVGRMWSYRVPRGPDEVGPDVHELGADDIDAMAALYRREPVRFLRPREDWVGALRCRWIMNFHARFWGVRRNGEMTAYLVLNEQRAPDRLPLLAEYAGRREDVAAALPKVVARMGLSGAEVRAADSDAAGRAAFVPMAESAELTTTSGTFLPLRTAACMEKLRPRMAECIGESAAARLRFTESGSGPDRPEGRDDRLRIALDDQCVEILGRAEAAKFLFGTGASPVDLRIEGSSSVIEILRPAFPLPTPWYGLSFV